MFDDTIINPDVKPPEKRDLKQDFYHFRRTLEYMGANVPIQVLCLTKPLEKSLIERGFVRVYDLIDLDLAKIEGLSCRHLNMLTARLDEFFSVCI